MPAIPQPIRNLLKQSEAICVKLSVGAKQLGLNHNFTLDGRFVGDIGELIAFQHFAIDLHEHQQKQHDGTCEINGKKYGVQVKCRRRSNVLDIYSQPEILVVIEFDDNWETWDVAYNGPGTVLSQLSNIRVDKNGKIFREGSKPGCRLHLRELKEAMKKLHESSTKWLSAPQRKSAKIFREPSV